MAQIPRIDRPHRTGKFAQTLMELSGFERHIKKWIRKELNLFTQDKFKQKHIISIRNYVSQTYLEPNETVSAIQNAMNINHSFSILKLIGKRQKF